MAQIILHVTNIIYFLSGAAVMSFGIIGLVDMDTVLQLLGYIPGVDRLSLVADLSAVCYAPSIYLTTAGSVVLALCVLGAVGFGVGSKFRKNHALVVVYGIVTLLFILFDIALIMFYAIDSYHMQSVVEDGMRKSLQNNFNPISIGNNNEIEIPDELDDPSANAWVKMQFEQSCCGVTNYTDYNAFEWNNTFTDPNVPSALVPPSCCVMKVQRHIPENTGEFVNLEECMTKPPDYTNNVGCSVYVMQQVTRYNFITVSVAASLTALQAIILAMVTGTMSSSLKKIAVV